MDALHATGDDGGSTTAGIRRRQFLTAAAGSAALPWLGGAAGATAAMGATAATGPAGAASATAAPSGAPNILFILVDQERLFRPGELPVGFELPGQRRLAERGTTFVNHRINSCVCTPSRSVIYASHDGGGDYRTAAGAEAARLRSELWTVSGW